MTFSSSSDPATTRLTGSRASQFTFLLNLDELLFLMEAHDGLSARIAEAEGFRALWASGLSISTAMGLRDSNEASWSQIIDLIELMCDATTVPIVVDGDSGHGNFNSARRFVRKAEQVGAAAVCFEDKMFPKMNSFVGSAHDLVPTEEFCGKLRACKDAQHDDDFCVIARTEALIAGLGMAEALDRAERYRQSGADAIFIHSRRSDASEIEQFMAEWAGRLPVVIAPTTYASRTPAEEFRRYGVSGVIWANHSMRAAFAAIRHTCREIRRRESINDVGELVPLSDIFELLDYDELAAAERKFFPAS